VIPNGVQAVWIAELEVQLDYDSDVDAQLKQHEANAHLIAAAPELLAALKALMDIRSKCFIPNDGDWWDEQARAAIAKAEGRQ
jgi:hypothetical protein